jgi:hypothetical protein
LIRIELQLELDYEIGAYGADFIFNVHAAHTANQKVTSEHLLLNQAIASTVHTDPATGNRYLCLQALPGKLTVSYQATVDLMHHSIDPDQLQEVPISHLPPQVLGYLYPSRYCQSDRFIQLANKEFGHLPRGYSKLGEKPSHLCVEFIQLQDFSD